MRGSIRYALLLSLLLLAVPANAERQNPKGWGLSDFKAMSDSVSVFLDSLCYGEDPVYVKSIDIQKGKKKKKGKLIINFSQEVACNAYRDGDIDRIYSIVRRTMPSKYASYRDNFVIRTNKRELRDYEPKYFSTTNSSDYINEHFRFVTELRKDEPQLVRNISCHFGGKHGLDRTHIALWQSHGLYFEPTLDRWEWQRSRLFGIVEDRFTQSFVIPLLVPMLENAGAVVLMPRERDTNPNEVIVDNDSPESGYSESGSWKKAPLPGFGNALSIFRQGENPFAQGTARVGTTTKKKAESKLVASWVPDIPEDGEYGVYVSYQRVENSSSDARYLVRHKGGETWFCVNQTMCSEKWVYLGKFLFEKGRINTQGVFLSNFSKSNNSVITADAVRFGGGMGNIARGNSNFDTQEISGHPRFNEAAMYWLQWAGYPDSVYSSSKFLNDYKDDIRAHGNWVNYLKNIDNVPVDLSLAFHSDAGVRKSDSIVGTLAIYSSQAQNTKKYPSGEQRLISKEYADIVQSQVVDDIRSVFGINWTRRGLWDRNYSEASLPEVPSMILELLSHQNFWDMRCGLDPNFKFVVARAVYKGILKFQAYLSDRHYVVQPLPVSDLAVSISRKGEECAAKLSWIAINDPLEPTAKPEYYVVYKRVDNGGFDNGTKFTDCKASIAIKPGHLYSFKVVAVNEGGASFPSETLCAGAAADSTSSARRKMLIVNNFNHIGAPASFVTPDSLYAGFRYDFDPGIPYVRDISYCGPQYEFGTSVTWHDDDDPGYGASLNTMETGTVAGNTFDYAASHAFEALRRGYDIVSSSANAFAFGQADTGKCCIVDLYCGRKDNTGKVFSGKIEERLSECAANGYGLILSGADIASGIYASKDSCEIKWFKDLTNSKLMTWFATGEGRVKGIRNNLGLNPESSYSFYINPNPARYCVPHPDAIIPARKNCSTIYRYAGSNTSAGTFRDDSVKVVTLGFPIEALATQSEIDTLMAELLKLFE